MCKLAYWVHHYSMHARELERGSEDHTLAGPSPGPMHLEDQYTSGNLKAALRASEGAQKKLQEPYPTSSYRIKQFPLEANPRLDLTSHSYKYICKLLDLCNASGICSILARRIGPGQSLPRCNDRHGESVQARLCLC